MLGHRRGCRAHAAHLAAIGALFVWRTLDTGARLACRVMPCVIVVLHLNSGFRVAAMDQQLGLNELRGKRDSQRGRHQQASENETA